MKQWMLLDDHGVAVAVTTAPNKHVAEARFGYSRDLTPYKVRSATGLAGKQMAMAGLVQVRVAVLLLREELDTITGNRVNPDGHHRATTRWAEEVRRQYQDVEVQQ